jgi:arylsulfatase A
MTHGPSGTWECKVHRPILTAIRTSPFLFVVALATLLFENPCHAGVEDHPNIVLILADDLGYGDLSSYGAEKIKTPNIDRLANEGVRFTDAHSPHSVCTPSRYGLMTGRYAWRSWGGHGVLSPTDPLLIDVRQLTLPGILKTAGYRTALIGKWHLGFGAPGTPGWDDLRGVDYNGELKPGPLEVGFDEFFGFDGVPCYIENHHVVGLDRAADPIRIAIDSRQQRQKLTHYDRLDIAANKVTGCRASSYKIEELSNVITQRAVKWIDQQSPGPFFLMFSQRLPHTPLKASERFNKTSQIGPYGDVINELDASVGEVLAAIDRRRLTNDTIVIFASDNGGVSDYLSGVADIQGHRINGPFFGQKTEVYEGGTRIPLIVRWPGVVKSGSTTDALVALTDFVATIAELLGAELPHDAGQDSFSFLHVLRGSTRNQPARDSLIMDSLRGTFAIREGSWKLIVGAGGGGGMFPSPAPPIQSGQLYDLASDPGEAANLYSEHPQVVSRLLGRLREIQFGGRSR